MLGRIIEIANDCRHLSLFRGFMVVADNSNGNNEVGKIPIDDIAAVIANAHGLSYTNNLLVALAERSVPFVLCGANHNVSGMLIPVDGNFQQAKRFDAQISATKAKNKQLWAKIVRAKLQQQAVVLQTIGVNSIPVTSLMPKVRSGDSTNIEAQAAKRYWILLFGEKFRRDRQAEGVNSLLNYGYTVLRASMARAVVAAGLHPTLGIHHSNEGNAMRLVDDLMEPFRPLIDLRVWQLYRNGLTTLNQETKSKLVEVMYIDMSNQDFSSPLMVCLQRLANSLVLYFFGESDNLELPLPRIPEEFFE